MTKKTAAKVEEALKADMLVAIRDQGYGFDGGQAPEVIGDKAGPQRWGMALSGCGCAVALSVTVRSLPHVLGVWLVPDALATEMKVDQEWMRDLYFAVMDVENGHPNTNRDHRAWEVAERLVAYGHDLNARYDRHPHIKRY